MKRKKFKYIFVSGGVLSGLGKGVTASSIGLLLKSRGLKVALVKCDPYVNIDAGTIRPQEHGEVFVTEDGIETDQDLGHYERFINENLSRAHYITTGQIYQEVIRKERNFEYQGEDVEVVPHVPEEMIRRFKQAGRKSKADVVIIEIGGTVGEYQNVLFLEANRIMKMKDKEEVIHIHVGYLPTPPSIGEMKSKPIQISVRLLNQTGIQPDFLVGRARKELDERRKQRIALFCNIDYNDIISNPYVRSPYQVPLVFKKQKFDLKILKKLKIKPQKTNKLFNRWKKTVEKINKAEEKIKIAIAGKYQTVGDYLLPDSYVCVLESLHHAAWQYGLKPEIVWLDTEKLEKTPRLIKTLNNIAGVIIPQGWGSRGVEGKIKVAQYAREKKIPYLGLCFGMQMAVIEFARNVLKLKKANSQEVDPKTPHPVIHIMPNQEKYLAKKQYGGTMRLGAWPCQINPQSQLYQGYNNPQAEFLIEKKRPLTVAERHRHRYEVNNKYRQKLKSKGLIIAGTSPDKKLVEAIELPKKDHPFFIGVQFHPEFKSRPLTPHPIFLKFLEACGKQK